MPFPEILSALEDSLRQRIASPATSLGAELARSERALTERFNQTSRRLRRR